MRMGVGYREASWAGVRRVDAVVVGHEVARLDVSSCFLSSSLWSVYSREYSSATSLPHGSLVVAVGGLRA